MEDNVPAYICIATCMNISSSSMVNFSGATVCKDSEINDVVAVPSSCDGFKSYNSEVKEEHDLQSSVWTDYRCYIAMTLPPQSKV